MTSASSGTDVTTSSTGVVTSASRHGRSEGSRIGPRRGFRICLTHDVDRVHKTYQYLTHDLRRGRIRNLRTLLSKESSYWCIDELMRLEDRYGVRSTFFMLEESIKPKWLRPSSYKLAFGRYRFSDPKVSRAIRELDANGWEVGLHGSYLSYRSRELLRAEKASLESVLGHPVVGIRQHYLNLDVPETWRLQREAGFQYDASYGRLGGIGYLDERRDVFQDATTGLHVVPLALMECYLFARADHDVERAWRLTLELMDEAEHKNSLFVVLWHQRMFNDREFPGYREVYERILREGQARHASFVTCEQAVRESVALREDVPV
jgi:peptidoglycan/xylan/chitin deacetylase (PgdA/CDA1 family)